MKAIFNAKKQIKQVLEGVRGISGIGISQDENGDPCVIVNVDSDIEKSDRERIPSRFNEFKVKVQTLKFSHLQDNGIKTKIAL